MRIRKLLFLLTIAVLLTVAFLEQPPANVSGATVPAEFTDNLLFNMPSPTALVFTPDGRLLVNTQNGILRVYQNGTLLTTPALTIPSTKICTDFERGLLGITVDPDFISNHYIYIYYTFPEFNNCDRNTATSPVNRVSRLVLNDNNLVAVDWTMQPPASGETVLLENIPSPNGNHNGGDLHFGQDGLLYISAGDGGCSLTIPTNCQPSNNNARRLDILSGKILRINKNGTVPATNPSYNATGARRCGDPSGIPSGNGPCQEMFAWGLRNPFRFAFQPGTNQFYINDVGQNNWEEINQSLLNADYGWNVREGPCPTGGTSPCSTVPAGMTDPVFYYDHSNSCNSITGGAFAPPGLWPAPYDGRYFFSDYGCGRIFVLSGAAGSYSRQDFVTGLGSSSAVSLLFGPYGSSQALYYTSYAGGGAVHVLVYTGAANRPPTALISASPISGDIPLTVNFNGSGSTDPDIGSTITNYIWNFGDGSPGLTTTTALTAHTYNTPGTFTATLKVQDNLGLLSTNTDSLQIFPGNTPPTPVIDTPTTTTRFAVGDNINLTGHATDRQDGNLLPSNLNWAVILHHNTHTHPFLGPIPGNTSGVSFSAPAPEDLTATDTSYLEIQLKATDSQGASTVITQNLQPKKVGITFATNPAGGILSINSTGLNTSTSSTITSWEKYVLNVTASQQSFGGPNMVFDYWADLSVGDPDRTSAFRSITTPSGPATYAATYKLAPNCDPQVVTIYALDDINTCGTLRYAVTNSPEGSTIDLSAATAISLNGTLNISRGLILQGKTSCAATGSGVLIQATGIAVTGSNINGLVLYGNVRLRGLIIKNFSGKQIVAKGSSGVNTLECTKASKA